MCDSRYCAGEEAPDSEEDSEEGSEGDPNDLQGSEEDEQHEELLARIVAEGSKRKKTTVVLNETVMEKEDNIAAAGHDMDTVRGELGLDELLHATQVSQADRKALQKLATGKKV